MTSLRFALRALFLALTLVLGWPVQQAQAQQQAPVIRMLLKSDAQAIFLTSRAAWAEKVEQLVSAGHGSAKGTEATGLILVMDTQVGAVLTLMPRYGEGGLRPEAIEVSIAYTYPQAALISDPELATAINDGTREMRPEYAATGRFVRDDKGVTVFFVIMEEGGGT